VGWITNGRRESGQRSTLPLKEENQQKSTKMQTLASNTRCNLVSAILANSADLGLKSNRPKLDQA